MTAGASPNPDPITHESLVATLKQAHELIGDLGTGAQRLPISEKMNAVLASLDAHIAGLTRPNPDANGCFWWLTFVFRIEIQARVLGRPSDESVATAQGFDNVADYREARGEP